MTRSEPRSTLARLHGMDDTTWARHANPWSVWTRAPILPLLVLAVWARVWLGWWTLLPLGLLLIWTWLNPRAFSAPATTNSWSARAVMGERVWLNRAHAAIPAQHARMAALTSAMAVAGIPFMLWGLWHLALWPLLFGLAVSTLAKFWFLDRMVWLYDDMARENPIYRAWLR